MKRGCAIEDSNSKALVATDNNEDIDWTKEFDAEPVTYAMMALTGVEQILEHKFLMREHMHFWTRWTCHQTAKQCCQESMDKGTRKQRGNPEEDLKTILLSCDMDALEVMNRRQGHGCLILKEFKRLINVVKSSSRAAILQGISRFSNSSAAHSQRLLQYKEILLPSMVTATSQPGLLKYKEVRRLKKQTLAQAKLIRKLKAKLKNLSQKHKKKVSSVKLGRNKDEGTLSEEHYVQEEDTADPFFDDFVDKDLRLLPRFGKKKR
ncbi:hypothetical protein Tco_1186372 [Tanacetum coccineum]